MELEYNISKTSFTVKYYIIKLRYVICTYYNCKLKDFKVSCW